jgi:hypothetical protein
MERVAVPPTCDSYALRHEQSELLLAAAGALRSLLRRAGLGRLGKPQRCAITRSIIPYSRASSDVMK